MIRHIAFACMVAFTAAAGAQSLPPVEAFGNLPALSRPLLSPDGKHYAVVQPVAGRPAVGIYSLTPGEQPAYVGAGDEGIIDYVLWAKNDRLIVVVKQGFTQTFDKLRTWRRAYSVDVTGKNMVKLLRDMPALNYNPNGANIIDVDPGDADHVLMTLWNFRPVHQQEYNSLLHPKDDDGAKYDVVRVDLKTGKGEVVKSGDFRTSGWLSDGLGKPVVQVYQTRNPLREHVVLWRDGTWSELGAYDVTGDEGSGIVGLSEAGTVLVQTVRNDQSVTGLAGIDIASGAIKPLFFAAGRDVSAIAHDEWTGRVLGYSYIDDKLETKYFDPKRQALQQGLQDAFPGLLVGIVSWDASKNHVIFAVEGPRRPPEYFYLDRTTQQAVSLAAAYPGLTERDLGEMKAYPFKARDGLDIAAYLTLPPGKPAKNLPIVVMPHGGPDDRDYIHFDWMAQFLANRGYLVFQPNFRGSSGYGHKFTEAGLQQWGLKMQDDITDGVRKLIADGIADPKRICIVGGSYGGYAALAGAAFTPDLYACAISWAGISDLPVELSADLAGGGRDSPLGSFIISRIGDDMRRLTATSPARHADTVKAPVLLLHGANDTTVRIEQSRLMADALKAAGKPVEFVTYPGEDHYLELASTRIQVLKEMERFLKQHIGN